MRVKFISFFILMLCFLSIIVGLLNFNKKTEIKKSCPIKHQPIFFKNFVTSGNKIALITLHGAIVYDMSSTFLGTFDSAENALKALGKADEDKHVMGVIFRINSPGGTVAMSQEIHNAVLKLRKKKPVIVSMADMAASGGYFVASAADRIYANPGTLTGSVGVILETMNVQGFLTDKLGIKSEIIKTGKFKDTGSVYRPLREDERVLLNNLVNNAYKQFIDAITEGRVDRTDKYKLIKTVLTKENLKKYADGRIFTGEQALNYGFVDKLGGLALAKEDIRKMAKEKFPFISDRIPIVGYNRTAGFEKFLFRISNKFIPKINNFESLVPFSRKYPRQPLVIWE